MKKLDLKERLHEDLVGKPSNGEYPPETERRFNQLFTKLPEHIRWRAIKKAYLSRTSNSTLSDRDSMFYLGNHRNEKIGACPICNQKLTGSSIRDYSPILGQSPAESVTKCPMGCYENSWSYSLVEITVKGTKVLSYRPYNLSWVQEQQLLDSLEPLFERERKKMELKLKQFVQLYHRKKKTQAKKNC